MNSMKRILSMLMIVTIIGSLQVAAATGPVLKITDVSEKVFESNEEHEITLTIENVGSGYAEDISMALTPEDDSPIIMTEAISYKYLDVLNPNVPMEVTFSFMVESGADPGVYNMTVNGSFVDNDGKDDAYEESFAIEVIEGDQEVEFEIVTADGVSIAADTEETIGFVIENKGLGEAKDVTVEFGDNNAVGIYATGDKDRYLASLSSFNTVNFQMAIAVDEDVSGYIPIEFDVTYDSGITYVTETVTTYVYVEDSSDASVIIRSISKSASNIVPDQSVTFTVVIENTSDVTAAYVEVAVSQEEEVVPSSQSVFVIDALPGGATETLKFTLQATDSAESQNYPIEFTVEVGDETISQYSGIYITNDDDDDDDVVSQPRIVVTDFNISSDKIFVGDTFDIDFDVLNTSNIKDIRNVKVVIDSSNSFMPLNQSNSYFVGDLEMEALSTISMPMKVFANADGGSYSLVINFEYEDMDGEFYEDSEIITIPVYEKVELTVSDVSVGSTLDNGYTLEVDFYNTGKVDITNMMVDLEGDFQSANSNYYVGDFSTGRTDVYDVEIMGTMPDTITGTIIFTYDDTFGDEETFIKEFTIGDESESAGTDRMAPSDDGTTANAAGGRQAGGGMTELTEEQRAELQEMSQEERMAYIEAIQNGEDPSASGSVNSTILYAGLGGAVILLAAAATVVVRRRRKAD